MLSAKLNSDVFFRKYGNIGFIYLQNTRQTVSIDTMGALFLSFLTREYQRLTDITPRLQKHFPDENVYQLERTYREFVQNLAQHRLVDVQGFDFHKPNASPAQYTLHKTDIPQQARRQNWHQLLSLNIELNAGENCTQSLPWPIVQTLLEQYRAMNGLHLVLSGQDPLLYPHLEKVLQLARSYDFSVGIAFKLKVLDKNSLDLLKKYKVGYVQTVLYSLNPEEQQSITQAEGSCPQIKKALKFLLIKGVPVRISCPVIKDNLSSCQEVVTWARGNNMTVTLEPQMTSGPEGLSAQDLAQLTGLTEHLWGEDILQILKLQPANTLCGANRYSLKVSADGNYRVETGDKQVLGDIRKITLQEEWDSKAVRQLLALPMKEYPQCMHCPAQSFCTGNTATKTSLQMCDFSRLTEYLHEKYQPKSEIAVHEK